MDFVILVLTIVGEGVAHNTLGNHVLFLHVDVAGESGESDC